MSSRWKQAWAAIAVVGLVAAMAYGSSRGAEDAPPDTAEATLLAETMLEAFDVGDYDTFTAEFTDVFRESLKLSAFLVIYLVRSRRDEYFLDTRHHDASNVSQLRLTVVVKQCFVAPHAATLATGKDQSKYGPIHDDGNPVCPRFST